MALIVVHSSSMLSIIQVVEFHIGGGAIGERKTAPLPEAPIDRMPDIENILHM
jgi:hypothetical protein